jgi:hypothetical protein
MCDGRLNGAAAVAMQGGTPPGGPPPRSTYAYEYSALCGARQGGWGELVPSLVYIGEQGALDNRSEDAAKLFD